MNPAEVVRDPGGAGWKAARVAVSVLFTVALVAYVVLRALRWRRARSERP
jgi:hypothetical protein